MRQTILMIGLGLIGGSLAKSCRRDGHYIIGYDHNQATLTYALVNQVIDETCDDLTKAAHRTDMILIGTPITETIHYLQQLDKLSFEHNTIVSDVASVKQPITDVANHLQNPRIQFIGGHPMAGSHKKGITAAKEHLFENALYVLTPSTNCTEEAVQALQTVLTATNSHVMQLEAQEHDEMTGVISHFPHLISSALVRQAKKWGDTHTFIPQLAAGGFRDVTRIASSNPELWQDIFFHNKYKMIDMLDDWIKEMNDLKDILKQNKQSVLTTYLQEAKDYRDGLGTDDKGAIPSFYDLYVDIRDQPGVIATVANLLADEKISITNIRILEIREGITGVLRLSVSTKEEQQQSYRLLKDQGYDLMLEE